jgi:hypothetical protein
MYVEEHFLKIPNDLYHWAFQHYGAGTLELTDESLVEALRLMRQECERTKCPGNHYQDD